MNRLFFPTLIVLVAVPGWPAAAQSADFHGLISGFVYNPASKALRPLMGIPGSTTIGSPVFSAVDFASVAPGGRWALIVRQGRSTFESGLTDLAPQEFSAEGLIDAVDRVAWSRDGSFAVLYASFANQLQRVRFSEIPSAEAPVDLNPFGAVSALAIDSNGRIAVGFNNSGLYLLDGSSSPVLLASIHQPAAAVFDETGNRLYAVDLDQQSILQVSSGAGPSAFASLGRPDGSASKPVGMALSAGSRYLLLADSAGSAILVYNTNSGSLAYTLPLDFPPSHMEPLSASPTFLLNDPRSDGWLLVLDASKTPLVYFVPRSQDESQ